MYLNKQTAFYYIWTFYCSMYFLCWSSSLKFVISVEKIMTVCNLITVAALVVYIIFSRLSVKQLVIAGGFAALCLTVFLFFNRTANIAILSMFMVAAHDIDYDEFVKFDFKFRVSWFIAILLMCAIGLIPNVSGKYYGVPKQSLGFQHPNTFGMSSFILMIEWIYIRYKKLGIRDFAVMMVLYMVIMYISPSRTTGYSFILICLIVLYDRYHDLVNRKIIKWLGIASVSVVGLSGVVLTYLYIAKNSFVVQLNKMLSSRLKLQAQYFQRFPINLFGQDITITNEDLVLDSGFVRILLSYGMIFFVVFIILYSLLMYRAFRAKKSEMVMMILFFVLLGFAETSMIRVAMNVSLLAIFNEKLFEKNELTDTDSGEA